MTFFVENFIFLFSLLADYFVVFLPNLCLTKPSELCWSGADYVSDQSVIHHRSPLSLFLPVL